VGILVAYSSYKLPSRKLILSFVLSVLGVSYDIPRLWENFKCVFIYTLNGQRVWRERYIVVLSRVKKIVDLNYHLYVVKFFCH
jgi:hypothetical protein